MVELNTSNMLLPDYINDQVDDSENEAKDFVTDSQVRTSHTTEI